MVSSTTIRVPIETRERLRRLAAAQQRPIGEVIDALLDAEDKRCFFVGLAADFTRLRSDPAAWADYEAETTAWEATLGDGLIGEPGAE